MGSSKATDSFIEEVINSMVQIPRGSIEMRDDRIKKVWSQEIDSFYLSKLLVTQDLYFKVTGHNPSEFKGDRRPVELVSWREAASFCNELSRLAELNPCYLIGEENQEVVAHKNANGFRLPTEAEWEYACKAGTIANRYGELRSIAWYKDNSENSTHPVGQKQPNPWGLFDMLGNVWEWCSDLYDTQEYGSYRIFRGGGFCDLERSVMATTRRRSHPLKFRIEDLGFRIARNHFQG